MLGRRKNSGSLIAPEPGTLMITERLPSHVRIP
jgi:hypothetical protein